MSTNTRVARDALRIVVASVATERGRERSERDRETETVSHAGRDKGTLLGGWRAPRRSLRLVAAVGVTAVCRRFLSARFVNGRQRVETFPAAPTNRVCNAFRRGPAAQNFLKADAVFPSSWRPDVPNCTVEISMKG